jgi:hypothetical protein
MRGTLPPPSTWQVEQVRGNNLPPARFSHGGAGGGGSTVAHVFSKNDAAGAATADEDERRTADELGNKMTAEIVANMEALHQGEHQQDHGATLLSICADVVSHFHPPLSSVCSPQCILLPNFSLRMVKSESFFMFFHLFCSTGEQKTHHKTKYPY